MTSGKKILGITAAVVGVLFAGRVGLALLNQPDDKTLIKEAIQDCVKASREGRGGGVLDYISNNFTLNSSEVAGNRSEVSRYVKNMKPDVEFLNIQPVIMGDEAKVESPAKFTMSLLTMSKTFDIPQVTVTLRKEEERTWFLVPTKRWKVSDIQVPMESIPQILSGGSE
jgi:hypothetical protein